MSKIMYVPLINNMVLAVVFVQFTILVILSANNNSGKKGIQSVW